MENSIYVALSRQVGIEEKMAITANNIWITVTIKIRHQVHSVQQVTLWMLPFKVKVIWVYKQRTELPTHVTVV